MAATLGGPEEFRTVIDDVFRLMDEDPEMGPALRAADVSQRLDFPDTGLVLNVRSAWAGEPGCLHWEWSDDVAWEPRIRLTMGSETAVRYFQGKENIAMAIARRRIRTGGDVTATLALIPLMKPVYPRFRELVREKYPHLLEG
jgi:hypothetical protein